MPAASLAEDHDDVFLNKDVVNPEAPAFTLPISNSSTVNTVNTMETDVSPPPANLELTSPSPVLKVTSPSPTQTPSSKSTPVRTERLI